MKTTILTNTDKEAFLAYVKGKEIDSAYRAEFTKIRRKRSLSQNNYMWMCIGCMVDYSGNESKWLYTFYLDMFPTRIDKLMFDEIHSLTITSSQFDSKQMTFFIENIRRHMAMNGVPTPDPDTSQAVDAYYYHKEKGNI